MITQKVLIDRIADLTGGVSDLHKRIAELETELAARKLDLVATRAAISENNRLLELLSVTRGEDGADAAAQPDSVTVRLAA